MSDNALAGSTVFQLGGLALFFSLLAYQLIRPAPRRHGGATTRRRRSVHLGISEIALLVLVNAWIAWILMFVLPWRDNLPSYLFGPVLFGSRGFVVAGVALITVAYGLEIAAVIALGDSWRLGLDASRPGNLVTHGIYARTRNPIYLFFHLYFWGTFLINGAMSFLVFALLALGLLHLQTLREEEFLAKTYGSDYQAYCADTPRYLMTGYRLGSVLRLSRRTARER